MIGSENPSISLQNEQPGDENVDPSGRYGPEVCGNPTGHWLISWGPRSQSGARVYLEPTPKSRRTREEKLPSPDQKSFHISTTRTTPGRKRRSPGSIPPRRVWKPQPNRVMDDCIGPMGLARGERCPPGQRRGPDAPGEDNFPSPDQKYHRYLYYSNTPGRKT